MSSSINLQSLMLVNKMDICNNKTNQSVQKEPIQTIFKFENDNTSDSNSVEVYNQIQQKQHQNLHLEMDNNHIDNTNKSLKKQHSKTANQKLNKKDNSIMNKKQLLTRITNKQVLLLRIFSNFSYYSTNSIIYKKGI